MIEPIDIPPPLFPVVEIVRSTTGEGVEAIVTLYPFIVSTQLRLLAHFRAVGSEDAE